MSSRHAVVLSLVVACALSVLALASFGVYKYFSEPKSGSAFGSKLGVYRSDSGRFGVTVDLCPGEHVESVTLTGKSKKLWAVSSALPTSNSQFVVGVTPTDFQQDMASQADTEATKYFFFAVKTDAPWGSFGIEFKSSDLRFNQVWVHGPGLLGSSRHVSLEKFTSVRADLCRLQSKGPGG